MDQNSVGFMHLKNKFPRIIDAKIKEGVFVGPHIGELINEVKFADQLTEVEKIRVEIIQKSLFFFLIIRQKTIVIWWLILYNPTKLWGVICL